MRQTLALVLSLLLLAACSLHREAFEQSVADYRRDAHVLASEPCRDADDCSLQKEVASTRLKQLEALDLAACKGLGGRVEGVGMFGEPACVRHFSDGGKTCSDSSECQGECMVYGEFKQGDTVAGQCSAQSPETGGCFAKVSNGKVQPGICI